MISVSLTDLSILFIVVSVKFYEREQLKKTILGIIFAVDFTERKKFLWYPPL